jgi:hypothetical protein
MSLSDELQAIRESVEPGRVWPIDDKHMLMLINQQRTLLARIDHIQGQVPDDVATQARVIGLWLKDFCDESLPYYEMIAEASRRAAKHIDHLTEENTRLTTRLQELNEDAFAR